MSKKFSLHDMLLPYLRKFVESKKRKRVWVASRQVGKSFTLAYLAAQVALSKRDALVLCISTGARAAAELLKKCMQMAEAAKLLSGGMVDYSSTADCLKFLSGGRILSLPSGNPSALRGYTASAIILDEAAFIERPEEVFSAIAPTLTRNPDSLLVVASTPAGKNGFFWKLWSEADGEWLCLRTTVHDAVRDGLKVDVEQLKATVNDPQVFALEYCCEFSAEYSLLVDLGLLDWYEKIEEPVVASYVGMDVGSTSDRTAVVTVKAGRDVCYVDDIVVMHKASYEDLLEVLRQLHSRHSYLNGCIDLNGIGSALAEFASKKVSSRISGYTWTSANKTPAYESLRARVFDHKVKFSLKFRELIEQDFLNVHRIVSETGKVTYEAGRGKNGHSDVTSAVVLALEAVRMSPAVIQAPVPYASFSSSFGAWRSRL